MRIAVGAVFVAGPADAEQPLALSLWIRGLVDGFGDRVIHRLELSREVFDRHLRRGFSTPLRRRQDQRARPAARHLVHRISHSARP
jgi:hypothetical protein